MTDIGIYNSEIIHIHLEPTSNCNARCPQCPRTFFTSLKSMPNLDINEWSADDLKKVLDDDFFKNVKGIFINGNVGDIVMHSDPKKLLSVIFDKNLFCRINTNGGAQPIEFWKWLGSQKNVKVEFGIDGLSDTHHLYRRNTRFETVIRNAKAFIDAGGNAQWMMTVFKHNEHQIKKCKKMSEKLGFTEFISRNSNRFDAKKISVVDKNFEHEYYLEPSKYASLRIPKDKMKDVESYSADWYKDKFINYEGKQFTNFPPARNISCKVQEKNTVFLAYDKRMWPCCWLGVAFYSNYGRYFDSLQLIFKDELNLDYEFNNVLKHSIKDILYKFELFKKIELSWNSRCSHMCNSICSKNSGAITQDIN